MLLEQRTTPVPYIPIAQTRRIFRLLYMQYRPYEIAEILGVSTHTIYTSYLPAGCPHTRDDNGDFWIVGTEFREWVRKVATTSKHRPKPPLANDETYCARCQQRVRILHPTSPVSTDNGISIAQGECSNCGNSIFKAYPLEIEAEE